MDQATLVTPDISAGQEALSVLDAATLTPIVALLMVSPEHDDWRFVLSSPVLDQTHPLRAYEQVTAAFQGRFVDSLPPILVLPIKDPFVRELRRIFASRIKVGPRTLTRLGGQTIGNRFVGDAYIYRVQ